MKRLYLIHRDAAFAKRCVAAFDPNEYEVEVFRNPDLALTAFFRRMPDAVILDISDESLDGIRIMHKMRATSTVPVILLTTNSEEIDEIMGLRLGADAVLRQSISTHLLAEWVKSLIKRHQELLGAGKDGKLIEKTLKAADLVMEPSRLVAYWREHEIPLTLTEFKLLSALAARPGVVKSRESLIELIHSNGEYVDERTIDSHVKRIRAKVREADPEFACIQTVYGIGYRFNAAKTDRKPRIESDLGAYPARLNG
ncbi:MAG: winged helix-turn-helix domain-containing protein [Paracoccaceae bacterium]|nr:MAG: winged helix-turn-helix domain-containing protein [Paracoccaceae bacterium]